MNYREAIRSAIIANAPLVSSIDTYAPAGSASVPAVFSPIKPVDHTYGVKPTVLIRLPTNLDDISPFQGVGSDILLTLSVFGMFAANSTDADDVEAVAFGLRDLFRDSPFVGGDGLTYQAIVSGPIAAPVDSPEMVGMALQLRINVGG